MSDGHSSAKPFEEGGHAVAEDGIVLLEGPDGIAAAMTADAASQTGESLIAAAEEARRQRSGDAT